MIVMAMPDDQIRMNANVQRLDVVLWQLVGDFVGLIRCRDIESAKGFAKLGIPELRLQIDIRFRGKTLCDGFQQLVRMENVAQVDVRHPRYRFRDPLEPAEALVMSNALSHATLKAFRMEHVAFDEKAWGSMCYGLGVNQSLRKLQLEWATFSKTGFKLLTISLQANQTLRVLSLERCQLDGNFCRAIANALCHNRTLQELNLGGNRLGENGAIALAESLQYNQTLQRIYLYDTKIGPNDGAAFGCALKKNHSLKVLHLQMNLLGTEGGEKLAEGLSCNDTLEELSLYWNSLGSSGVAICQAVTRNDALKALFLGCNGLGSLPEVNESLLECVKYNNSLTNLDLAHNNIPFEVCQALIKAAETNHMLRRLHLTGNRLTDLKPVCASELPVQPM